MDIRDKLNAVLSDSLSDLYVCDRVWSAWGYGTMGPGDFRIASGDEELVDNIVSLIMSETKIVETIARATCVEALLEDNKKEIGRLVEKIQELEEIVSMKKVAGRLLIGQRVVYRNEICVVEEDDSDNRHRMIKIKVPSRNIIVTLPATLVDTLPGGQV